MNAARPEPAPSVMDEERPLAPGAEALAMLAARERALLAREQAADLRDAAAELRDQAAHQQALALERLHLLGVPLMAQLREANETLLITTLQMSVRAERDFLTGLPNRALLTDRLAQAIVLAQRHRKRVALLYLDLDNFKTINDSHGHTVGDDLLRSAAQRLERCVRQSDTVSRHGGDEFVVLLSEVKEASDATHSAGKLIRAMTEPHQIGKERLTVTISVGISLFPDDGQDADTMLRRADTAMYGAKRAGRNHYLRWTAQMSPPAVVTAV